MGITPNHALPYPELTDVPNVQPDIKALALAVDAIPTPPAATSGTLASRPVASATTGSFYYATDQDVLYFSNGTTWNRIGLPAGSTTFLFGAASAVPTGWVRYDGSNLPASTGIYADLYAHLGNSLTKPDTRARVPVDNGTHADVTTIGQTEGVATVGNRRQKHRTSDSKTLTGSVGFSDPSHSHTIHGSGTEAGGGRTIKTSLDPGYDYWDVGPNGGLYYSYTGIAVNNGSLAVGGSVGTNVATDPLDCGAYYVGVLIAKL